MPKLDDLFSKINSKYCISIEERKKNAIFGSQTLIILYYEIYIILTNSDTDLLMFK